MPNIPGRLKIAARDMPDIRLLNDRTRLVKVADSIKLSYITFMTSILRNINQIRSLTVARKGILAMTLASLAGGGAVFALPSVLSAPQDVQAVPAGGQSDPLAEAAELYKEVKKLQFDGAEDSVVDQAVYKAFEKAYAALSTDTLGDAGADQCRGMLLDLNNALARAAIHASVGNNNTEMTKFAKAYVDTQLMPQMATAEFNRDPQLYPSLVYVAASGSYNARQIDDALRYFEEYLRTGEQKQRESVALFYGQSLLQTKQPQRGLEALVQASNDYPANLQILTIAMQMILDTDRRDLLPPLLERALTFKPNDEKLLNLQAQVYESKAQYRPALDIYMRLQEAHPNSLNISEDIARCYYNLGTGYYNESIQAVNEKDASKARRQSNAYFSSAAESYEQLSANDPNNVKYLKAMGTAYACLGNKSKVDAINVRLSALGETPMAMNTMPVTIGDGKSTQGGGATPRNIPSCQQYSQEFVSQEMVKWAKRGEFEKVEDYTRRMSADNILREQKRLSAITADKYLNEYGGHLQLSELKLQPYDVENETYAINSDFGPVYIKVPLKNKEAEVFKSTWEQVQIRNAKFFVKDDAIAISTITFQTPAGKEYTYNASAALAYEPPVVTIDPRLLAGNTGTPKPAVKPSGNSTQGGSYITMESDVDKEIPSNKTNNTNTIALIIANENYSNVTKVESARHDGDVFARYCRETLGIPENQVLQYNDATLGKTLSAMNQLKNVVSAMGPTTDVIVYYAGHGVPDENSKEAFMLPTDADPMVTASAYPLSKFYQDLSDMGASNVMVFMDACFSGSNRGDGMLAAARGVVLRAQAAAPKGNMFVLSAADGNETALPWQEKNHGLFTYFLLKKLKDTKGNASLQELADYVKAEVSKTASLTLKKPQTPTMTVSGALAGQLSSKKLRK